MDWDHGAWNAATPLKAAANSSDVFDAILMF
jgi:hypothetical protein